MDTTDEQSPLPDEPHLEDPGNFHHLPRKGFGSRSLYGLNVNVPYRFKCLTLGSQLVVLFGEVREALGRGTDGRTDGLLEVGCLATGL